jgi:NADH dehydrogenase, FAD-containing subunit
MFKARRRDALPIGKYGEFNASIYRRWRGRGGTGAGDTLRRPLCTQQKQSGIRAQVTLVDRNPTHIWKPLLHEVAAGSMDPFTQELEYAAQARWHGFEFQQGDLTGLDRANKRLTLGTVLDDDGAELLPERQLEYDTLIIAIGSTTAFFGVKGAPEFSLALDTVSQAERFRKRLIAACIRAGAPGA